MSSPARPDIYTLSLHDALSISVAQQETHLPVIVDPSHATGRHDLVAPMSKAALAAGADGVMIDVHPHPTEALCDGDRKSTRLNSSHEWISYAVFCLKKKNTARA